MSIAAIFAFLSEYSGIIIPLISALIGLLIPSPLQKASKKIEEIHEKGKAVDEGRAPTSDLDNLP